MARELDKMHTKHLEAVKFVAEKKDSNYHDLMARPLVENETYIFVGYLMLRDALKSKEREILAEKFVLNAIPEFHSRFELVMSNDFSTIDRHREIIDY